MNMFIGRALVAGPLSLCSISVAFGSDKQSLSGGLCD